MSVNPRNLGQAFFLLNLKVVNNAGHDLPGSLRRARLAGKKASMEDS